MIRTVNDAAVDEYLAGPVVDARLEVVSLLGNEVLAELTPSAGTIKWDNTDRRGSIDVDAVTDEIMTARHPFANLGQVLEARWVWPELGISVPCGRWLISEPGERTALVWQASADPEGPARLARAQWWVPGGKTTTGTMGAQIALMMGEGRVSWTPPTEDRTVPATECAAGDPVLTSIQKVLDDTGVEMRPDRHGSGVILSFPRVLGAALDWSWSVDDDPRIHQVVGAHATDPVPNRVTIWCEEEAAGVRTVRGWSEPLMQGPRRWDGPYGRVPLVVKLDAPATTDVMHGRALYELRQAQISAATVRVDMIADPRIEVGDIARITSAADGTYCTGRVTSASLDAGTGRGVIECAVLSGTVANVPADYINVT